jgi:hypothetical protein
MSNLHPPKNRYHRGVPLAPAEDTTPFAVWGAPIITDAGAVELEAVCAPITRGVADAASADKPQFALDDAREVNHLRVDGASLSLARAFVHLLFVNAWLAVMTGKEGILSYALGSVTPTAEPQGHDNLLDSLHFFAHVGR